RRRRVGLVGASAVAAGLGRVRARRPVRLQAEPCRVELVHEAWRRGEAAGAVRILVPLRQGAAAPLAGVARGRLEDAGLGHDRIHRDVVRLRMDGLEPAQLEADADRARPRRQGGEGAVVIAAAVAQAIALFVEADQRHQQNGRPHHFALRRDGYVPKAALEPVARAPGAKLERTALLDHGGQRGLGALLDQATDQLVQADLAPDRPVEADELAAELRKARLQVSEYPRLQLLALALRQRFAGADQLVPPRAPPAPDLVPGLHHRSPRPPALRGPLAASARATTAQPLRPPASSIVSRARAAWA